METLKTTRPNQRREFLTKCFATGSLLCFGCLGSTVSASREFAESLPQDSLKNEEMLRFALGYSLPLLKKMQVIMGKMPFLDLLEKSADANMADKITALSKDTKERSMKKFAELIIQLHTTTPVKDAIQYEITEQTDKVFEMKVTSCIVAKIFREMNASNLGYAMECHPSDAAVKAFNPAMKCTKVKNMMIGDPFCVERYEMT